MTARTEEFRPRHATPQRPDAKFFFANQGNMRKNTIQEPLLPKNIATSFPALAMTEFSSTRLSTPLTESKAIGALSSFHFSTKFEDEERKLKFRIFRKKP